MGVLILFLSTDIQQRPEWVTEIGHGTSMMLENKMGKVIFLRILWEN